MTLNIAVIPGDGIGKEIVPEGLKVLDRVLADKQGIVQRIRQNKAERHQGVKEKIQRNIEKAARVRDRKHFR